MEMRIRKPINVTLDPDLIEELDLWLHKQSYKTARAAFIETAIKRLLAEEKAKDRKR